MPAPTAATAHKIDYDVLICTFNGGDYIAEQLHSILQQTPKPRNVWISDDGSKDQTHAIVKQIAEGYATPVHWLEGPRRGVIANILWALPQTQSPYVFLADQDDIWLDNKAALFCAQMTEQDQPHLIFSDAWVWHPDKDTKHSFWELDRLRPNNAQSAQRLAFHNTVQGASACVNRALIDTVVSDSRIMMHDWWLALIAAGLGKVSIIREPTLLYRQHDNNQVGSQNQGGKRKKPSFQKRWAIATRILNQAKAFAEHYEPQLKPADRRFFASYRKAITGNLIQRSLFILRYWPRHRDLRRTISLWGRIVLAFDRVKNGDKP